MKKILFSTFVFLWTITVFSQTNYEKGYYLDNQGNKNEGYFKIINFEDINDKSFKLDFKKELSQEATKLSTENITEFGIAQDTKYQKMSIEMDDVDLKGDFDKSRNLELKPSTVFLNVVVEGNANLYAFVSENGTKYFYKINDKDNKVTQLVYKKYLNTEGAPAENAYFREQMFNNVKCESQTYNEFLNIKYDKNQLVPFFENFNKCQNSPYVVYKNKFKKSLRVLVTAFAGVSYVSFNMTDVHPATNSGSAAMPSIGGDLELLFPSEKWAFFTKVEYSYLKTSAHGKGPVSQYNNTVFSDTYTLDSGFLDIVFGMRWYHGFSNGGKLFLGAGIAVISPFASITQTHNITIPDVPSYSFTADSKIDLGENMYFNFEVGYKFNQHFGIEAIVDSNKNIIANEVDGKTKLFRSGLNFRYTF